MNGLERLIINLLLQFTSVEQLNEIMNNGELMGILVGSLVAISGAVLGSFLLLRRSSLVSDAISHTVLLGIVMAFLIMTRILHQEPEISSPWLIIGAAMAGVVTVFVTELIFSSGLVKSDAALGLTFPLLFAIAIILIARYADDVHLDEDTVMVGQIGLTAANANTHCLENCESVTITPDHPMAEAGRRCTNCAPDGQYSPRDPEAVFEEYCFNCGVYSASEAYNKGFIEEAPAIVRFPKTLSVMGVITLINLLFVALFYKELKLATFDQALAAALGFRPVTLYYIVMALVSVTAVGAFDAVGAVLVVAFFIVPPAAAYLLTERLSVMLLLSAVIGVLSAYTGWHLAGGNFLGIYNVDHLLEFLDQNLIDLGGNTRWSTEHAAAMVIMNGFFFLVAWIFSPRYGLIVAAVRRWTQRWNFAELMLLGHICHHEDTAQAAAELTVDGLHEHLNWSPNRTRMVLGRLQAQNLVSIQNGILLLTERGQQRVQEFNRSKAAL